MKAFYSDTLLDEENICNLTRERDLILKGVHLGKKLVVYGPRNFGKTSLVRNVVIPRFQKKTKEHFVLFVDLMEVKSMESIHQRIKMGFEQAFAQSFPKRHLLETAKRFLLNLRPQVTVDVQTGEPSLTITSAPSEKALSFGEIFRVIRENIAKEIPTLIVLDEFQDIAFIPEAQGLMRQALQELKNIPLILMGSKRHILSRIFSQPAAPLAAFGEDVEFHPIPYEEYHRYILERFQERRLMIELKDTTVLQDALFRIPEAINIVCAYLCATYDRATIGPQQIFSAINAVVDNRRSRYEELLALLSEKEEEMLVALAKHGSVQHPNGVDFLKTVNMTARTVKIILDRFLDKSLIEKTNEGYRVSDPLFFHFLKQFR